MSERKVLNVSSIIRTSAALSTNATKAAVSLKHDGTDGTVKMANLPVPSVSDRRDRLSVTDVRRLLKHDGADGTQKKRSKNA